MATAPGAGRTVVRRRTGQPQRATGRKTRTDLMEKTTKKLKAVPAGYNVLTPHLNVRRADRALDFYKRVFGGEEVMRMAGPDGRIMHAELKIGDSHLFLADESPEMGSKSPQTLGG